MTANTDQARKITVLINQKPYHLDRDEATGRQLKALAGIPEENLLFLEVPGPGDVPVPDDEEFAPGQVGVAPSTTCRAATSGAGRDPDRASASGSASRTPARHG
ncbi:MAG: hypothetical protein U0838_00785 [Chloroflexota bacterium]